MFSIFPVASKKSDNTGGIAATIIVVLLLIGTLVGLLICYLRTRREVNAGPTPSPSSAGAGFNNETYEQDVTVS